MLATHNQRDLVFLPYSTEEGSVERLVRFCCEILWTMKMLKLNFLTHLDRRRKMFKGL